MITYRFELRDDLGFTNFGTDKVKNWDAIKPSIIRNITYKGLYRTFTNTFDLVDNIGKRFLQLYDTYGIGANAYLKIYIGNGNKERSSFIQIGDFELKAKFENIKRLGRDGITSINFVDSGFQDEIMSRDDTKVNYQTYKSIDNDIIEPFSDEFKTLILHDRTIEQPSKSDIPENITILPYLYTLTQHRKAIKSNVVNTADEDIKSVFGSGLDEAESFFLLSPNQNKTINIKSSKTLSINCESSGNLFDIDFLVAIRRYDSDLILIESVYVSDTVNFTNTDYSEKTIILDIDIDVELNEGDSLVLYKSYIYINHGASVNLTISFNDKWELDTDTTSYFEKTETNTILPFELFTRLLQIYTGLELPFYSELFGRADLGYAQDGEWAYLVKATGKMIRGFPKEETQYNTSLKDEFKAYNAIANLAATIDTINGVQYFRIEKYSDILDSSNIIDLGGVLNNPERSVNADLIFTSVKCGYKNEIYEENGGLNTFNGQFEFSLPVAVKNKAYDIVNIHRADDYGIELARRINYVDNPKKDSRYDDNKFFIDAKLSSSDKLEAVKAEDFTTVNNIPAYEKAYNLRISPKRNLLRHSDIIKSSLYELTDKEMIYISGANNPDLETMLLIENSLLVEKDNILISDLTNGKIKSERFTIKIPFSVGQWMELETAKNNLFKFVYKNKDYYGFIDKIAYMIKEGTATVELMANSK